MQCHHIAFPRFYQCPRQWRNPAYIASGSIDFINANNRDCFLLALLVGGGNGSAEKNPCLIFPRRSRIHYFSRIQPFGKKKYAPVDLSRTLLSVAIVSLH